MPIFQQGYRTYEGPRVTGSRALAIAWGNIRPRLRWWTWVMLLFSWFPVFLQGAFIFIATAGARLFGDGADMAKAAAKAAASGSSAPQIAFEFQPLNMATFFNMTNGDSIAFFWNTMQWQTIAALVVPAIACAGILASDRRTSATQIYFSRPVTRLDYLGGKFLAVTFFVTLVTGAPALVLWLELAAFADDNSFALHTWYAPLSILVATMFYALWAGSIVLAISAVAKRARAVAIGGILLYLVLETSGVILTEALDANIWRAVQPSYVLGGLTAGFFGLELPLWLQTPWILVQGLLVPVLLLLFVWRRLSVEERVG